MKRKLQLIAFTFVATFLFTNLSFAQFILQKGEGVIAPVEKDDEGEWIHWDTGESTNSIGINAAANFSVASRWDADDLADYDGMVITKIRFAPNYEDAVYTLKIWEGLTLTPGEIYSQNVESVVVGEWNEVALNDPIPINAAEGLWFGYNIDTQGGFPAGCDDGPVVPGKGNMILWDGAWVELTALNDALTYNWSIQAFVEESEEPFTVVDIIVGSDDHTTLATAVTLAGLVEALSGEGPFTVFAPTDDAFDALPDGLLDALIADPEGDLTKVLLYHVAAGNVLSGDLTDGMVITTLLGQELTVTIDGGDVFINDVGGNSVQVTVPDLEADNGVVHVVDGVLIPDLTVALYNVTFVVDMNPAVDDGFDPAVHKVFMTGNFLGWAEPGTEGSVELSMVVDTKEEEELLYPGNWLNATEIITGVWTGMGPIFGTNGYNDGAYGQIFEIDQEYTFSGAKFIIGSRIGDAGVAAFTIWDYSGGSVGAVIASKAIEMADITVGTSLDDAFVVMFDDPVTVTDDFLIGVDLSGLNAWADGSYELANSHSGFGEGAGAALSLVLEGSSWVPVLDYDVDVDIAVFPMIYTAVEPGDAIYTVTLEIEEGTIQYKYFSDAFGEGWDGGEWAGDPNRSVLIDADMTINDIWGEQPVSVVENELAEQGINLFPNPVRNTLYVENSDLINDLRIFDLTGRMIFSQVVNDNATSINVSEFKTGVYIMQVMTVNGVVSKRFSVQ